MGHSPDMMLSRGCVKRISSLPLSFPSFHYPAAAVGPLFCFVRPVEEKKAGSFVYARARHQVGVALCEDRWRFSSALEEERRSWSGW